MPGSCVEEGSGRGFSPYRGPFGEVGPSNRYFENSPKEGSGYGASPSTVALLGEPAGRWGGSPWLGTL